MDFLDTMNVIERRFSDGEPLQALILALGLRQSVLAGAPDPEHLGWLRYTRVRCLHAMGLDEEGLAVLDSVEPASWTLSRRCAAWTYEVGAELAWRLDRPVRLVEYVLLALRERLADRDLRGAEQVCVRGLSWLEDLSAPELAEELVDQVLSTWRLFPLGSAEALSAATLGARVARRAYDLPGGPKRRFELALWQAAASGERGRVKALLMLGVDPGARVASRLELPTPLMVAASRGHVEVVEQLLAAGASVDPTNVHGHAALHVAADSGQIGIVRRLLEAEARTELADEHGRTPLHLALWRGHRGVERALLAAGAAEDAVDREGMTPRGLAARADAS